MGRSWVRSSIRLFALLLWTISATHEGYSEEISVPYPGFKKGDIGRGFDPETGQLLGPCLVANPHESRNPALRVKFHTNSTIEELYREIYGHASFGINLGVLAHSASLEVLKKLARGKLTLSIVAELDYHHGTTTMPPRDKDWADLPDYCKKGYVKGYRSGAKLLVSLRLTAENEREYQRIVKKVSGRALWGLLKSSRTEIEEFKEDIRRSRVTTRIYPIGFQSPELADLPSSAHCLAAELTRCLGVIDKALSLMGPPGGFQRAVRSAIESDQLFITSINVETGI